MITEVKSRTQIQKSREVLMVSSSVVYYSDCSGNLKSVFDFPNTVRDTASHGTYFYSLCFYKGQHYW